MKKLLAFVPIILVFGALNACSSNAASSTRADGGQTLQILAVESFLADITQNIAGDRAAVHSLIPLGLDPHAFEPTPKDVSRIAESDVLIVNGAGFEEWLDETIQNAGGDYQLVTASEGLTPRETSGPESEPGEPRSEVGEHGHETDPHFWFDPVLAVKYVENIRDGLITADPAGKDAYTRNAQAYIRELEKLNEWAVEQTSRIPSENRLLVTNHESFGYFADRYGFKIIGAVLPSVSTSASPSAKQLADLIQAIRESGARAIFLETGANPEIAQQIAEETGVIVVTGLYSHSLSAADGPAPNYIEMMRYNISLIVSTLK